jgi:S1-C subfamily serine protease
VEYNFPNFCFLLSKKKNSSAVQIISIKKNSAAFKAGLLSGDIIIKFNDYTVSGIDDLQKNLGENQAGTIAQLTVLRQSKLIQLDIIPHEYNNR